MSDHSQPQPVPNVYYFRDIPQDGSWEVAMFEYGDKTMWMSPEDLDLPERHIIHARPVQK